MFHNPHTAASRPFVIRRLDTDGYKLNRQIPASAFLTDSFLYLTEGEVLTDVGTEPFLVGEGKFLFIPEGIPFSIKYYNGSKGYMGAFSRSFLKSPILGILYCRTPLLVDIPEEESGFVASLAEKLFREQQNGNLSGELLSGTLDLFLRQIASLAEDSRGRVQNDLCSRFLDMVFDRDAVVTGVSAYAVKLGVSPNHLNRVVKNGTGRSAGKWIDISRVTLSKQLLRQSGMPVIDIASRCGFDDQSYFSRFFKKCTGMTPSEFRSSQE